MIYTQQQKKRETLLLLKWLKIKYVEFKKCILHVKLTQFKSNKFSRFLCFWVYVYITKTDMYNSRTKTAVDIDNVKRSEKSKRYFVHLSCQLTIEDILHQLIFVGWTRDVCSTST